MKRLRNSKLFIVSLFIIFLFLYQTDRFVVLAAETNPLGGSVADCYKDLEKCNDETKSGNNDQQSGETHTEQLDIGFMDVFKMVAALLFVIAILYFLLKFINKKSRSFQQNQIIQNFGGTPLGGNRSIQLVKVGDRLLVLGVGENIQLLKEINNKDELEQIISQYEEQVLQSVQPKDLISKMINKVKENDTRQTNGKSSQTFQQFLKGQLDDIKKGRNDALGSLGKKESKKDE